MPRKKTQDTSAANAETKRMSELETMVQQLIQQNQQLAAAVGSANAQRATGPAGTGVAQLAVGIRNVSSYTIGIDQSPMPNEPPVQLTPFIAGQADPRNVAVVSYAWWLRIRQSSMYAKGMVIRDDSILGDHYLRAPADRPEELAPGHAANVVLDPIQFIESQTEAELHRLIMSMTSEPTLRRLSAAVDHKIALIRQALLKREPKYDTLDMELQEERESLVMSELPAIYQRVDHLVDARLDQLAPKRDF